MTAHGYDRGMVDPIDPEVPEADRQEQSAPVDQTSPVPPVVVAGGPAPEVPEADWFEQQIVEPDVDEGRDV